MSEPARNPHHPARKTYLNGAGPDIRVPMREVRLTTGDAVVLYDTSGPYTDPGYTPDPHRGLPSLRGEWVAPRRSANRAGGGPVTQRAYARRGEITPEMQFVALREGVSPEFVRDELACGRAVLPANVNHPETEPMIIGRNFLVKVNANIGNSAVSSDIETE